MKTIVITISCIFMSFIMHAQSDQFKNAMLYNLELSKSARTVENYQELANNFERIATAEQKEWTAWYYSAFYNLIINFQDSVSDRKQKYIAIAQQQIDRGLKLKPGETELMVLKVMSYYVEMAVDPMKGMTLLGEANALLDKAKSIDPDNPRIYLEEAEAIHGMPVEFGGGIEKAKPLLLLAREKFSKFVPADPLAPDWGKDRCDALINIKQEGN
jgi:hypothetical protein